MEFKRRLLTFIGVSLLAVATNFAGIPLFFDSLNILLGGAFLFFILEVLGLRYALVLSVVLAVQRFLLYENPVGALFIPIELVSVYALKRLLHTNLILSGWVFWVAVGLLIYHALTINLVGIEDGIAVTLTLKESVNGLLNVTLANLFVLLYSYYFDRKRNISYVELVFVSLVVVAITPMFLKSIYQAKAEENDTIRSVRQDMDVILKNVEDSVTYWLNIHLNAVKELANRLVIWGTENREQLQKETEAIRRAFKEFHACYIADKDATAITFYPEINPKGKYMIGTNFNYRPYYKKVKKTQKYTFTKVFIAKFALRPVVGIAVPAVKDGKFLGYAYCGLKLDRLRVVVEEFSLKEGVYITLLDSHGKVITSNMKGVRPLQDFEPGKLLISKAGLTLDLKEAQRKRPFSIKADRLYHSFFYKKDKLREDIGWSVVMEVSLQPYMNALFSKLNVNFASIYLFALLSFFLARFLTRVSTRPIQRLADTMDIITRKIEERPQIRLPETNLYEVKKLTEAFELMAIKTLEYMDELKKMAYYDPLTGLPNRTLLRDRIESAIHFAKRNNTKVAILFIDLDYFKTVNDTLGHEVGDRILVQVAKRLSSVFRETDTVARFGGDEFVAVLPNVKNMRDVIEVAERVLRLFDTPFDVNEEDIYLSASVGIALYPDNGETPSELIKNADMAMYRAKEEGKNNFAFFTEELNQKAMEIMSTKNKLHRALERGEFVLHYQPIYSIKTGSIVGFEALLRWNDPERGLVPPGRFIPILEELGLIKEVGRWVMLNAFRKSRDWGDRYGIYISVNISPRQFTDRKFINRVLEIARETDANAEKVVLEITETSLMKNPEESVSILKRLRAKGFSIAIDDFGTGYSSLVYLKRFPMDIIKIDMNFTQQMVNSDVDRAIVASVVNLAHSLKLKSLAEGVETEDQLKILRGIGCELAQGYLFGKPMPEEEAEELIRKEKGL
ncbi:EAL domain-containing protein [Hydrogenivirga sp.]